jgi:acetate kinase
MTFANPMRILTINAGSSSLKAGVYDNGDEEELVCALEAERIGQPDGSMRIVDGHGTVLLDHQKADDHGRVLRAFLEWLHDHGSGRVPSAVGHRIVHGGQHYRAPHLLTADVLADLRKLVPIDPDHLPQALAAIQVTRDAFPHVPQVVCFDTAFHRTMPRVAQMYALPRTPATADLSRYGFHGLSCEYIVDELRKIDPDAANGRIIVAHLGNGASLTAVRGGTSVDTTMGFTPTGGLMMGTRSGDLDPGVLLHLLEAQALTPAAINRLVNHQAGLLGVSGSSADMRDLLEKEGSDPGAAEAVALFCYLARKFLGALVVVLGGLDTLIFTAGIGEHAAPVRARICAGLEFIGLDLDAARNDRHGPIISSGTSQVTVRVMKTDEDVMIARHVRQLLSAA